MRDIFFLNFNFFKKSRDEKRRRTLWDPKPADVALGRLPTDEPAHTDTTHSCLRDLHHAAQTPNP